MVVLITGGAGFIGSSVIRYLIKNEELMVVNVDKLTYAGNLKSLAELYGSSNYRFVRCDICDQKSMEGVFNKYQPDRIMNLAAESHVDRSISGPGDFVQTNIFGTYTLLEVSKKYWEGLSRDKMNKFRFHHVSTDEVYGDLGPLDSPFSERTPYRPSSPYSASKASSDHLVRAWHRTYGLPIVITNCSNNYGPYQFPEKLIPLMILNALKGKPLPIYGEGNQIRDWLYVEDHAKALIKVCMEGCDGETYNIGGNNELQNIDVVKCICRTLDQMMPNHPEGIKKYEELITFVADRPGHDRRYAVDSTKIQRELQWIPEETFETGIVKTVEWYLKNDEWVNDVVSGEYQRWVDKQYQ